MYSKITNLRPKNDTFPAQKPLDKRKLPNYSHIMRHDMFKVIVERERLGGGRTRKGKQKNNDSLPQKEGIRRPHRGNRKSLNENLSPLKRFLNSAVGRPWNKVFSEMCEHINVNSTVQKHIRDHIFQYVERHVLITEDGKITQKRRRNYSSGVRELWHGELYIHPSTGLLLKYKRKDRKSWKSCNRYTPPTLATTISLRIEGRGAKGKTVEKDGVYYKVFFNAASKAWDIFNKATAAHAKTDFTHHFGFWSDWKYGSPTKDVDSIFRNPIFNTTDNVYLKTLHKLYVEGVEYKRIAKEKEELKKKAEQEYKLWQKECPHFSGTARKK